MNLEAKHSIRRQGRAMTVQAIALIPGLVGLFIPNLYLDGYIAILCLIILMTNGLIIFEIISHKVAVPYSWSSLNSGAKIDNTKGLITSLLIPGVFILLALRGLIM